MLELAIAFVIGLIIGWNYPHQPKWSTAVVAWVKRMFAKA